MSDEPNTTQAVAEIATRFPDAGLVSIRDVVSVVRIGTARTVERKIIARIDDIHITGSNMHDVLKQLRGM